MKRKMIAEGQLPEEEEVRCRMNKTNEYMVPQLRPLMESSDDTGYAKRVKLNPQEMFPQIPNLDALQSSKFLPFIIALAALLVELCESDEPPMLCQLIDIAQQVLQQKKRKLSVLYINDLDGFRCERSFGRRKW